MPAQLDLFAMVLVPFSGAQALERQSHSRSSPGGGIAIMFTAGLASSPQAEPSPWYMLES